MTDGTGTSANAMPLGDQASLAVQQLHQDGKLGSPDRLLRIENRAETESAPFQFDAVNGILHRRGCSAIPHAARTALYGLWRFDSNDQRGACPRCKPVTDELKAAEQPERTDLLFGLISVVDQFAGVLKERGKDYQRTAEGQKLTAQLDSFYRTLGQREKEVLDTVLLSLDQLVQRIRQIDTGLNTANGEDFRKD